MLNRRKFLQIAAASTGLAITGTDLLNQAVANASSTIRPGGSNGIGHVVILMMENRSFDHFLGWLPGADGRHDMTFVSAVDGNTYPNYPLAPDFQGCGYSDPDHSWEGWLVEHNNGKMDGFLQRPTTPPHNTGVKLAAANPFARGYYPTIRFGTHARLPDLPVIWRWPSSTLDRYFCSFAGDVPQPVLPARGPSTDHGGAADHLSPILIQRHPHR
jgi:phospholipase C